MLEKARESCFILPYIAYCSLFWRELHFAKMGRLYLARTNFRDLKGKSIPGNLISLNCRHHDGI